MYFFFLISFFLFDFLALCFSFEYFYQFIFMCIISSIDILHIFYLFLHFIFSFYFFPRFSEILWTRFVSVTIPYTHLLVVISALNYTVCEYPVSVEHFVHILLSYTFGLLLYLLIFHFWKCKASS